MDIPVKFEGKQFVGKGFVGPSQLKDSNPVIFLLPDVKGCKSMEVFRASILSGYLGCSTVVVDLYGDSFPLVEREKHENVVEAFVPMNALLCDPVRLRRLLGEFIKQAVPQVNGDSERLAGKWLPMLQTTN